MRKALGLCVGCALALSAAGTEPAKAPGHVREIYVPFDALSVLFEKDSDRVLLPRNEYEALLAKAENAAYDNPPPHSAFPATARYEIRVSEERAAVSGILGIDVLAAGLHAVPLRMTGLGLRRATLDQGRAALAHNDAEGIELLVEGIGRHTFTLDAVTPLQTTAARQILTLELPMPAATQIGLTAPGDVELKSGAAVAARVFDPQADETRFELVAHPGPLALVMTLNSRLHRRDRVVVARSVLVAEVAEAYERLHATVALDILHRAVDHFHFSVPPGFEVTDVSSPDLARWAVARNAGTGTLEVRLREAKTGTVVLGISALRTGPVPQSWKLLQFRPQDVIGQVAVVGILLEDRLTLAELTPAGLIPIDNEVLTPALPPGLLEHDPGRPPLHTAAAYYAPAPGFALAATFRKPAAELRVTTNLLLRLRRSGLELHGGLAVLPMNEKRFTIDFGVPAGWSITGVTTETGEALPFERYGALDAAGRIHVRLPAGVPPGRQQSILFSAAHVPPGWMEPWPERELAFPVFAARNATRDIGAIAVHAGDDLRVRPLDLRDLTPLNENEKGKYGLKDVETNLAYRYESSSYAARFVVTRTEPRLTATTYSFFRLERDMLTAHTEARYEIAQAGVENVSLCLPASTPAAVTIRGLGHAVVKEYSATENDAGRTWNVQLARMHRDTVALALDFQQALSGPADAQQVALPLAAATGVAYQSGFVAVEGSADLDVRVLSELRKVDIGELVDAEYQPGARLVGAYGFVGDPPETEIAIRRHPGCALPAAIVERAEMTTLLSANGRCQSAARFLFRAKSLFVEIRLPPDAALWGVTLDRKPARPQREGNSVLLGLPAVPAATLRDLEIVYETPLAELRLLTETQSTAPQLRFHDADSGAGGEVPTMDLLWRVHAPTGYLPIKAAGTVTADALPRPPLAASQVARTLYRACGGVTFRHGLIGGGLDALGRTRSTALLSRKLGESQYVPDARMADFDQLAAASAPSAPPKAEAEMSQARRHPRVDRPQEQLPLKERAQKPSATWAVEGAHSLTIELMRAGPATTLRSLGENPHLALTLVDRRSLDALTWAVALAVFLGGLYRTRQPAKRKAGYVAAILLAATLLPLLPPILSLGAALNGAFYAACLLVPYYLIAAPVRRAVAALRGRRRRRAGAATALVILAALTAVQTVAAAGPGAARAASPVLIAPEPADLPPVTLPEDAIIVLYDATRDNGRPEGDRLLVPRKRFMQLWERAYPENGRAAKEPPVPWAVAGLTLEGALVDDDVLQLEGRLDLSVYVDHTVEIPLPLAGAVLARAALDGNPARLRVTQVEPAPPEPAQQQALRPAAPPGTVLLVSLEGRGRHRLDLALRIKLGRRGGWRVARAHVPAAPAAALSLHVPKPRTEVRLGNVQDRQTYETTEPDTTIETALAADGRVSVEWRPRVSAGVVDQALTAESTATLDILEDRLQLAWSLALSFRAGERDFFTVELPADYLVEKVDGTNVRGWEVQRDDDRQRLEVGLLKAAKQTEKLTVHAWLPREPAGAAAQPVNAPLVNIVGAARHTGVLTVRRSPGLDVRTADVSGLTRIDMTAAAQTPTRESPLGIRPFQAYRFVTVPFQLNLTVQPAVPAVAATVQSILRIAARERTLESCVLLKVRQRPIHRAAITIPRDLEVEEVTAPGLFQWTASAQEQGQEITVYFSNGLQGEVPVVLHGRLGATGDVTAVTLPRIAVRGVTAQTGEIVVQADPAFAVRPADLENVESVLLKHVYSWLQGQQRTLARLALRCQGSDYSGRLELEPRKASVTSYTVTNARVTDRTVEETTLISFSIHDAGLQTVLFRLPAHLVDARISAPLLRQQTITPDPDGETVTVRLELQDQLMGQLRVLIEHDRLITDAEYTVRPPTVLTGRVDRRYLAVESAGRDEVLVTPGTGVEPLQPQHREWRKVAGLLAGGQTQAYVANPDVAAPELLFRVKQRAEVKTAGARIGIAEALLIVDGRGAYRASQTYQVDNQTEQFLEIDLPRNARLWTARVAGELVRPSLPDTAMPGRIQIPLVKTAAGDLDYSVVLKYGGIIEDLGGLDAVTFPLIRTRNIQVELSQVELRLPQTRKWLRFAGTMRRVTQAGEFEAGYLAYQNKMAKRLVQTLQFGSAFEKARALSNLKQVGQALELSQQQQPQFMNNTKFNTQVTESQKVLYDVNAQVDQERTDQARLDAAANRGRFNDAFAAQDNTLARNQVLTLDPNWDDRTVQNAPDAKAAIAFNGAWLADKGLGSPRPAQTETDDEPGRPVSKPQAVQGDRDLSGIVGAERGATEHLAPVQLTAAAAAKSGLDKAEATAAPRSSSFKKEAKSGGKAGVVARYRQRLEQQESRRKAAEAAAAGPGMAGAGPAPAPARDGSEPGGMRPGLPVSPAAATGLASLDVELPGFDPRRWRRYRFTTPRGDVLITAATVSETVLTGLERLAVALIALLLGFGYRRLPPPGKRTGIDRRLLTKYMIVFGFTGLLLGVFPILAAAILAAGAVWRLALAVSARVRAA